MVQATRVCPRCGYDLSGTIDTWSDSCPLTGRCTECGLDFRWYDIMVLAEHPWLFEYGWRRRPVWRLAMTWKGALRPRRFWRELRLTDPIFLRPIALVAIGLFLLMYLAAYGLVLSGNHGYFQSWNRPGIMPGSGPPGTRGWTDFLVFSGLGLLAETVRQAPGLFVAFIVAPLSFVVLPRTLGDARVRPRHIIRIWLYSLPLPLTVLGAWALTQTLLLLCGLNKLMLLFNPWMWAEHAQRPRNTLGQLWGALPGLLIGLLVTSWLAYWFFVASRWYLRLEHPARIVAVLTTIVVLAVLAAQVWGWMAVPSVFLQTVW